MTVGCPHGCLSWANPTAVSELSTDALLLSVGAGPVVGERFFVPREVWMVQSFQAPFQAPTAPETTIKSRGAELLRCAMRQLGPIFHWDDLLQLEQQQPQQQHRSSSSAERLLHVGGVFGRARRLVGVVRCEGGWAAVNPALVRAWPFGKVHEVPLSSVPRVLRVVRPRGSGTCGARAGMDQQQRPGNKRKRSYPAGTAGAWGEKDDVCNLSVE